MRPQARKQITISMLQCRNNLLCAAVVLIFLGYSLFALSPLDAAPTRLRQVHSPHDGSLDDGELDRQLMAGMQLPEQFGFRRYCVDVKELRGLSRESLTEVPGELDTDFSSAQLNLEEGTISNETRHSLLPPCSESFKLDVPEFASRAQISTSSLMLGVATKLERIEDSLQTMSRWLSKTGTTLVILVIDRTELRNADVWRLQNTTAALDIKIILEPYQPIHDNESEGYANFGLATALNKHRGPKTRWFGVIDDDTFFLSLQRMVEALAPYDPEKEWYIGTLSEGHTRVAEEGFKAWGGAGFFISRPLMHTLAQHADRCVQLDAWFGDDLWRDCIQEVTSPTVQLTELRGLNQMDISGDVSGWYEAGFASILTVHHWKSWHHFPVAESHIITDVAGADAFLHRYLFGGDTVLTNGYSIVQYPKGLPDLNLVEQTMVEDVNLTRPPKKFEFHRSFGRTRPALEIGSSKISWKFKRAVKTEDGLVRQFYIKRGPDADVSVIEVDWRHA